MKRFSILVCILLAGLLSSAQLENVVIEVYDPGADLPPNPTGEIYWNSDFLTTYRVYAELTSPQYHFIAMFGVNSYDMATGTYSECAPFSISSSSGFYNSIFSGALANSYNPAFATMYPEVLYDSWLTINQESVLDPGQTMVTGIVNGLDALSMSELLAQSFGPGSSPGTDFLSHTGHIFTITTGGNGAPIGPNNRVLLGQVSVSGCFEIAMNISIRDSVTDVQHIYTYSTDCVPLDDEGLYFGSIVHDGNALGLVQSVSIEELCEDPNACNYLEMSCGCDYLSCAGCDNPAACNYMPEPPIGIPAMCEFTSCTGCMEPEACNYDPDATESGACDFTGCITCNDPAACNYTGTEEDIPFCCDECGCDDPNALNYTSVPQCQVATCQYMTTSLVYHDQNNNGIQNMGEPGIPGITVNVGSISGITNADGFVYLQLPYGNYGSSVVTTPEYSIVTQTPSNFNAANAAVKKFGITNDLSEFNILSYVSNTSNLGGMWFWNSYVCDTYRSFNGKVFSLSPETVDAKVEVVLDPLMLDFQTSGTLDSIANGIAYLDLGALAPLDTVEFEASILAPNFEFMGQTLNNQFKFKTYYNGQLMNQQVINRSGLLLCAYDPNDKQVFPPGYAEPHFISPDTTLEYTIRFQNTGNFFAQNVVVVDTISEYLDLSSLEIIDNTHAMETIIDHDSREVKFTFPEIFLPDSTCCGEESIGSFVFRVRLNPDLPSGTLIENTAHIFFDANPAIVTNTTWNTVFTCSTSNAEFTLPESICAGTEFNLESDAQWFETHEWYIGDLLIGSGTETAVFLEIPGTYVITHKVGNPLCESEYSASITVLETPENTFTQNGNVLTAPDGVAFQWFLDGLPIENATSQSLEITESGEYRVFVTGENGCTRLSQPQLALYTSVNESIGLNVTAYPVPVAIGTPIQLTGLDAEKPVLLELIDNNGRMVWQGNQTMSIPTAGLAPGNYLVRGVSDLQSFAIHIQVIN